MPSQSPVVVSAPSCSPLPPPSPTADPPLSCSLSSNSASAKGGPAFSSPCTPVTTITVPSCGSSNIRKATGSASSNAAPGNKADVSSWLSNVQEATEPESAEKPIPKQTVMPTETSDSHGPPTVPTAPSHLSHSGRRFTELPGGRHRHDLRPHSHALSSLRKLFPRKLKISNTKLADRVRTELLMPSSSPGNSAHLHGRCVAIERKIGVGTYGTVYLVSCEEPVWNEKRFVFKVLKQKSKETTEKFHTRTVAEFVFGNTARHPNVLRTLDFLDLTSGERCHVLPYCSGGDLYSLIRTAGKLKVAEADCFFKQLLLGVEYLHSTGLVHRDIKPENLLLTDTGVLKIADFGTCETFKDDTLVVGQVGSVPYLSPELCFPPGYIKGTSSAGYYPPALDVWACGIVYIVMRYGHTLWWCANAVCDSDAHRLGPTPSRYRDEDDTGFDSKYAAYVEDRHREEGFGPIQDLGPAYCHDLLYCILDPHPLRRLSAAQAVKSEWMYRVCTCVEYPKSKPK